MDTNNKIKKPKRKKIILISGVSILLVSTILFLLAYRYLIERVERTVTDNNVTTTTLKVATNVESNDWNYKSDNLEINIQEVVKGSGADKITYFVANVQMKDTSSLQSAFAKNEFGRNIIETTSAIAKDHSAIFAINGDYYGFRSDGVLIRNGTLYRNSPARISAALYTNGTMDNVDETKVSAEQLLASGVTQTLSFGPVLVDNGTVVEDFNNVKIDNNFGNRSVQGANPRTGVGMIAANHFVFVVVDGRKENYSKGMTLTEFAQVFKELGCTEAYNLDGGGSSTMYFMGRVVNNPLGQGKEREISDILYIKE